MQDTHRQNKQDKIRETIIQNVQKGQIYRVKFAQDAEVYEGMPIASTGLTSDNNGYLEMRVSSENRAGEVLRRPMQDIIWMEEV